MGIDEITHFDLCKHVAEWAMKKYNSWVVLYEYQSSVSNEFPDVLSYASRGTDLFEIKVSRQDFQKDGKKQARKKWKPKLRPYVRRDKTRLNEKFYAKLIAESPELYYIEAPHLGVRRSYVCPEGLIHPDEVLEGWGLYWYKNGRMFEKKRSGKWRPDVRTERNMAAHAFRRYGSGDDTGILVGSYQSSRVTIQ